MILEFAICHLSWRHNLLCGFCNCKRFHRQSNIPRPFHFPHSKEYSNWRRSIEIWSDDHWDMKVEKSRYWIDLNPLNWLEKSWNWSNNSIQKVIAYILVVIVFLFYCNICKYTVSMYDVCGVSVSLKSQTYWTSNQLFHKSHAQFRAKCDKVADVWFRFELRTPISQRRSLIIQRLLVWLTKIVCCKWIE